MVSCPLAERYVNRAAREARSAADVASSRKDEKYAVLYSRYLFWADSSGVSWCFQLLNKQPVEGDWLEDFS